MPGSITLQHLKDHYSISWTFQRVEGGDLSLLLSSDEALPGLLCPVAGFSVQERHGHIVVSPAKSHEDGEGTGACLL